MDEAWRALWVSANRHFGQSLGTLGIYLKMLPSRVSADQSSDVDHDLGSSHQLGQTVGIVERSAHHLHMTRDRGLQRADMSKDSQTIAYLCQIHRHTAADKTR